MSAITTSLIQLVRGIPARLFVKDTEVRRILDAVIEVLRNLAQNLRNISFFSNGTPMPDTEKVDFKGAGVTLKYNANGDVLEVHIAGGKGPHIIMCDSNPLPDRRYLNFVDRGFKVIDRPETNVTEIALREPSGLDNTFVLYHPFKVTLGRDGTSFRYSITNGRAQTSPASPCGRIHASPFWGISSVSIVCAAVLPPLVSGTVVSWPIALIQGREVTQVQFGDVMLPWLPLGTSYGYTGSLVVGGLAFDDGDYFRQHYHNVTLRGGLVSTIGNELTSDIWNWNHCTPPTPTPTATPTATPTPTPTPTATPTPTPTPTPTLPLFADRWLYLSIACSAGGSGSSFIEVAEVRDEAIP